MRKGKINKRGKTKVENLYKILDTTANAGQKKIKEKYIEKIREFPPETYPDEFENIREAYETLRSPQARREYDLMRRYGGKIEKLMEKAMLALRFGKVKKAKKLLHQIDEIFPNNIQIYMALGDVALLEKDFQEFNELYNKALALAEDDEKEMIDILKIRRLLEHDCPEIALEELNIIKENTNYNEVYEALEGQIYKFMGEFEKMWPILEKHIPSVEDQSIEDIHILIDWFNVAVELEKWNEMSKIKNRFQKLLKGLKDEDEKFIATNIIGMELSEFLEVSRFREAEVLIELLYTLDPRNHSIRERRNEIRQVAKLQKEINRMSNDQELIPIVFFRAIEMYGQEYMDEEQYEYYTEELPLHMIEEMEDMHEEIAIGIMRVKKKYKLIYNEFKNTWDEMLNRYTEGFNREMRRQLKKLT